jgi:hypothetical protein
LGRDAQSGSFFVLIEILFDGQPSTVRENLWNFLAQHRTQRGFWWIDALCIDQNSTKERNHQVALMEKIYRNAKLVIAWLGLGLEEALETLIQLGKPKHGSLKIPAGPHYS